MSLVSDSALPTLSADERRLLLMVAREALTEHLSGRGRDSRRAELPPALLEPRATFVTLRERASGELRGCRGEVRASRSLIDSVCEMVIASATGDPRFEPVRRAEIADLSIDISVLGPLRPIEPQDIEVGRHGLMIVCSSRSGLLLPSVPVALGWDRDRFLAGLCAKAGLPETAWTDADAELLAFETVSWGDTEEA